jgi:hypothetical protein
LYASGAVTAMLIQPLATALLFFVWMPVPCSTQKPKPPAPKDKPAPSKEKDKAPPPQLRPFLGKLGEAKAHAKERNAGLLIHIILEGEESNNKYRDELLKHPELIAASEEAVVLISNNGTHSSTTIEVERDGKREKQQVCSVYPWFESCGQHQQHFNDLYLEYREEDGNLRCPQTVLIGPDGKLALRINTGSVPTLSEILAGFDTLHASFGPGLSESEWVSMVRLCADARSAQLAQDFPRAALAWDKIYALRPKSEYAVEAKAQRAVCEKALVERLNALQARLVPASASEAYRELLAFEKACTGLTMAAQIKSAIQRAEANKELKDALARVRLEIEAEGLLETASGQHDANQKKELEKTLKKLFAKRLAETPAAVRARQLWPELVPKDS